MLNTSNIKSNSSQNFSKEKEHLSDIVKDHFNNPRNIGSLNPNDDSVGTATVGKAACGDVIKLFIKVDDGIIKDVKFKAFGCGSAIASSSYATELIKGKTINDALKLKNKDISDKLALEPIKIHCSLLAEDAIKIAIRNYLSKANNKKMIKE
uniref:Uncharacterized protein LOC113796159 n=1 Tax=Dermatophagoides pteronyssinus TaxID=6956 RepID=A0A6P6Y9R8_DERPT|nr:uncharacterized protein LOC113796159 [Dermatophagoides pteronyssinus]